MSTRQLIEATLSEDAAGVEKLLQGGGDINQQDEQGWTALKFAAGRGDLHMVKLMVASGADIFLAGRDMRTPYMVALAASRVDVAAYLKQVEESRGAESPRSLKRQYCRAYRLSELRRFSGWREDDGGLKKKESEGQQKESALKDGSIVYLHQDGSVTTSLWPGENIIFNDAGQQWKSFCLDELGFDAPDDLELVCRTSTADLQDGLHQAVA